MTIHPCPKCSAQAICVSVPRRRVGIMTIGACTTVKCDAGCKVVARASTIREAVKTWNDYAKRAAAAASETP